MMTNMNLVTNQSQSCDIHVSMTSLEHKNPQSIEQAICIIRSKNEYISLFDNRSDDEYVSIVMIRPDNLIGNSVTAQIKRYSYQKDEIITLKKIFSNIDGCINWIDRNIIEPECTSGLKIRFVFIIHINYAQNSLIEHNIRELSAKHNAYKTDIVIYTP